MKVDVTKKTKLGLFILALCISIASNANNRIDLNFDGLFPATSYQKALDSCMQLWGDIEVWSEGKNFIKDYDLLADIIVGKLFYVRSCIGGIKRKKFINYIQDIEYLLEIVDKIAIRYKKLFIYRKDHLKSKSATALIKEIKCRLTNLIS